MEDLEKASETANHENGRLRATVDKLSTELKEYRKRLSLNASGASYSPPQSATQSRSYKSISNSNDPPFVFPKFGDLPASFMNNGAIAKTTSPPQMAQRSSSGSNPSLRKDSTTSTKVASPTSLNGAAIPSNNFKPYQAPTNGVDTGSYDELSGLFSPSILQSASRSNSADYVSHLSSKTLSTIGAPNKPSNSTNGHSQAPTVRHESSTSITGSPASSMSHALDSSCGTTPESSADSPDPRKGSESALDTINEEGKTQDSTTGKRCYCAKWASACDTTGKPVTMREKKLMVLQRLRI